MTSRKLFITIHWGILMNIVRAYAVFLGKLIVGLEPRICAKTVILKSFRYSQASYRVIPCLFILVIDYCGALRHNRWQTVLRKTQ